MTWRLGVPFLLTLLGAAAPALPTAAPPAAPQKAEEVTIYRDEFGVPNIYATTEEGAVFGHGYAQAEDRLEELLKQYRRAAGTMAEAFGPEFVKHDYRQRLWQHQAIAQANYPKLPAKVRALCEAFQAGVAKYMQEHPKEVPTWAPKLEPWQVIALSRYIIWGWPEGEAGGDLLRAGITPDPISPRGSNQWVVTPARTADGHALALVDPHLSWYGEFRFYEARMYGGTLQTAGVAIPGLPFTTLGHNRHCSVAMTTGGPDTGDVYEEETDPKNPRKYKYDDAWRDMTVRTEVIRVKDGDRVKEQRYEIEYTHHGPVVARRGNKAYTGKLANFDQWQLPEQAYLMATAKNLGEMKKALSLFQLMQQNVMVATVDGDIFYLRNGRVPIRPNGYDWKRPVPGNTSKTEWQGFHPIEDLVQSHNPWQGYLQNCNVSPEFMTKFCPMMPARYAERSYLYNYDLPLHQRAAAVQDLLHQHAKLTVPEAMEIALSTQVHGADQWQARLAAAWEGAGPKARGDAKAAKLCDLILRWNRRADADSTGAIAYRYWIEQLPGKLIQGMRAGEPPPRDLNPTVLLVALQGGAAELEKQWGRLEVKYGDVYRVGRKGSDKTYPVGGGSVFGLATPRAISFSVAADGKTFIGRGGQTSVQLIQLSNPPRSWTLLPLGQSDRPESKHFDDQARLLFGPGKMKPTYFLDRAGLMKHVTATKTLQWPAR
jgi:acyl-homoserine lactone acylase PvdQ